MKEMMEFGMKNGLYFNKKGCTSIFVIKILLACKHIKQLFALRRINTDKSFSIYFFSKNFPYF